MKVLFLVGSGIGNQVETLPAFHLAKRAYGDITVVNMEPYNIEATRLLFEGLADVRVRAEVRPLEYDLQMTTAFCTNVLGKPRKAYPHPYMQNMSEVEYNLKSTGLNYTDDDFAVEGLEHLEPVDAPDVIIHDGYNRTNCGDTGPETWKAKSYARWGEVATTLVEMGYNVGCIGIPEEAVSGTEDMTGLPLCDTVRVLKGARVVLSNDTGTYHLCNLIGRPNIAIFTMTGTEKNYDSRFHLHTTVLRSELSCAPCRWRCKKFWFHNRHNCGWACRSSISSQDVVDAVLTIL